MAEIPKEELKKMREEIKQVTPESIVSGPIECMSMAEVLALKIRVDRVPAPPEDDAIRLLDRLVNTAALLYRVTLAHEQEIQKLKEEIDLLTK